MNTYAPSDEKQNRHVATFVRLLSAPCGIEKSLAMIQQSSWCADTTQSVRDAAAFVLSTVDPSLGIRRCNRCHSFQRVGPSGVCPACHGGINDK